MSRERPKGPPITTARSLRPETPSERYQVGAARDALCYAFPFGGEDLLRGAAVRVLFGDLDDLDREVAAEAFRVVGAAVGGPALQPADGDNGGAPDHSKPKS
jgi:hypothetical protein